MRGLPAVLWGSGSLVLECGRGEEGLYVSALYRGLEPGLLHQNHISINANDILDRFVKSGVYEKHIATGKAAEGGLVEDGVKDDPSGVKKLFLQQWISSFLQTLNDSCGTLPLHVRHTTERTSPLPSKPPSVSKSPPCPFLPANEISAQSPQTVQITKSVFANPVTGNYVLDPHRRSELLVLFGSLRITNHWMGISSLLLSPLHTLGFGIERDSFEKNVSLSGWREGRRDVHRVLEKADTELMIAVRRKLEAEKKDIGW